MQNFSINDLSINPQILAENGYKEFKDPLKSDGYHSSWQKCIRNDFGKAYFINFYFYDLSDIYKNHSNLNHNPFSWQVSMQLNPSNSDLTMNIELFSSKQNLQQIETYLDNFFKLNAFNNYEYYNYEDEEKHQNQIKHFQALIEGAIINSNLENKPKPASKIKL